MTKFSTFSQLREFFACPADSSLYVRTALTIGSCVIKVIALAHPRVRCLQWWLMGHLEWGWRGVGWG